MNSIQRVLAALTHGRGGHGTPDRVPVLPVPLLQGALVHDCSVPDYLAMPARSIVEAQVALNEMLGGVPDGVAGFPNVIQDVTAFGVGLSTYFERSSPSIDGLLIRDYRDIASIRVPDPTASPELRKTLDIIRGLANGIGQEKVVLGACIAPFSLPSMLMGTEAWMRLLYTPELRNQYLRPTLDLCLAFVKRWIRAQHDAGAHLVVLADGMASATILPRDMFRKYALPVIQETISSAHGMVAYEAVGRIEPFVDLLADVGSVGLLIGSDDDIANCKRLVRGRVAIIGNVNNMMMRRWSPARVELAAKAAIKAGKEGYGFALSNQGPEIPLDTSMECIKALVESVEKYGRYADTASNTAAA